MSIKLILSDKYTFKNQVNSTKAYILKEFRGSGSSSFKGKFALIHCQQHLNSFKCVFIKTDWWWGELRKEVISLEAFSNSPEITSPPTKNWLDFMFTEALVTIY